MGWLSCHLLIYFLHLSGNASNNIGRQQRVVMEEHHQQQHIYQPAPGSHGGTLPSQSSTMSQ